MATAVMANSDSDTMRHRPKRQSRVAVPLGTYGLEDDIDEEPEKKKLKRGRPRVETNADNPIEVTSTTVPSTLSLAFQLSHHVY